MTRKSCTGDYHSLQMNAMAQTITFRHKKVRHFQNTKGQRGEHSNGRKKDAIQDERAEEGGQGGAHLR